MFGSTKWNHVAALVAVFGSFLTIMLLGPQRSGAVPPAPYRGDSCSQNECMCAPNLKTYGYFPTTWREWPGEARPDKTFPPSINKEVLPTPQGSEIVPPPPAAQKPAAKGKQEGGIQIPFQLGPGGGLQIPGEQPKGIVPGAPGGIEQPAPFQGLPGGGLPGLPGGGLPGLPSEPETPAPESITPPAGLTPPLPAPSPETPPSQGTTTPPAEGKPAASSAVSAPMPKSDSHTALLGLLKTPDSAALPAMPSGAEIAASAPEPETSLEPEAVEPKNAQSSSVTQIRLHDPEARRLKTFLVPPDQTSPMKSSFYVAAGSVSEGECLLAAAVRQASSGDAPVRQVSYESQSESPLSAPLEKHAIEPSQGEPANTPQGGWRRNNPSVALGGYCCVTLVKNESWVKGNPRWNAEHQGRTYLFASAVQRECFLVDPNRYIPACAGNDPVQWVDKTVRVPGQLDYCVTYGGRLYTFSSAATLARFRQDPERYVAAAH